MKKLVLGFMLLFVPALVTAQHTFDAASLKQLNFYQDSLQQLTQKFIGNHGDPERENANYSFIKTLVSALKTRDSYYFAFDSLKNISILNSPDGHLRIMTWHILYLDGSYRYYGAIQMNTGANLLLYPLEDYSPLLSNPEDSITDNHKWYGAQYYKIIEPDAGNPYYILLGWKGNTIKSTKKVIDVLSFSNSKPILGLPLFDSTGKTHNRVVFEFSRQASMLLRYIPERHLIVFDHLAPADTSAKGKFYTYGPDLSYSGYQLKKGRWLYVDALDMRNLPDVRDEQYAPPKQ